MHTFSLNPEDRSAAVSRLAAIAAPTPAFYALTALSTLIAAFGLLANSTAVVIGAMLVAPLMGPIFGLTMGLVRGDMAVLRRAAVAETSGVALAVSLGVLVGFLPLHPQFGSEILGRTSPNILDLAIALVSGSVGAYCMVDRRLSETIAGVAIATAIVPPLATCGLCLAGGMYARAGGAFLLFGTNFLAIQFAATIVFLLSGLEEGNESTGRPLAKAVRMLGPGLVVLIALGIWLTRALATFVEDQRLESALRNGLGARLGGSLGAQLDGLRFSRGPDELRVVASVLTPVEVSASQVDELELRLEEDTGHQIHLIVRTVISRDVDREGTVYATAEERQQAEVGQAEGRVLDEAAGTLRAQLAQCAGAELVSLERRPDGAFRAVVQSPDEITPHLVAQLEQALTTRLGSPGRLVVRSILTRDADASRFIYDPAPGPPLAQEAIFLQAKLETLLQRELAGRAAELLELRHFKGPPLLVVAKLRAPVSFSPADARELEAALHQRLGEPLRLVLNTRVEGWADAEGYLPNFELPADPGRGGPVLKPAPAPGRDHPPD